MAPLAPVIAITFLFCPIKTQGFWQIKTHIF